MRRTGSGHDAPEVATGGLIVVVGALAACSCELELPEVVEAPALCEVAVCEVAVCVLLAFTVALCRVVARATAPRVPAAPAPRVIADTQARPLSRASCRADLGVAELFMLLQSWADGRWLPGCSGFMTPRCGTRLSIRSVLPLKRL
jgi:hypothetical protein